MKSSHWLEQSITSEFFAFLETQNSEHTQSEKQWQWILGFLPEALIPEVWKSMNNMIGQNLSF